MNNPYNGINAHLNSLLQTPGTALWTAFHQMHITFLVQRLNRILPRHYRAVPEHSLQIKVDDDVRSRPRPDATLFQRYAAERGNAPVAAQPVWTADLTEDMTHEELYPAVVIRQADDLLYGKVITRLELLSPSNKPGGSAHRVYQLRRIEAIQTGVPLVEIDYLHESRSPINSAPIYPVNEGAFPYTITVTDPRPELGNGKIRGYAVHVDEPLPVVPIPLADDDVANFDFDALYQYAIGEEPWATVAAVDVDMTTLPARFETYSAADQERIRAVMGRA